MVHTFSDSFVPSLNAVWIIPRFIFSPPPPRRPSIFLLIFFSPARRPLVRLQSWTLSTESWAFKVSDEFFSSSLYTAVSQLTGAGRFFVFYVRRSVSFLSARCLFGGLAATASAQAATFSADSEQPPPLKSLLPERLLRFLLKKRVSRVQVSVKQHVFSFGPHVSRPSLLLQQTLFAETKEKCPR